MSQVSDIVSDANAMLAQIRRLSQQAAGESGIVSDNKPSEFSNLLAQALTNVSGPEHEAQLSVSGPNEVSSDGLTLAEKTSDVSLRTLMQVQTAAIRAYQEIENMQI